MDMAFNVSLRLSHVLENNSTELLKYVCPRCDYLLRDAVQQMSCGHWMCDCCAKELSLETVPRCPRQDCKELWRDDGENTYFPDRFVRKTLNKFAVMCINTGCEWRGILEELSQHLWDCEFSKQQCLLCKQWIKLTEVKTHEDACLEPVVGRIRSDGEHNVRLSLNTTLYGIVAGKISQHIVNTRSVEHTGSFIMSEPVYPDEHELYLGQRSECVTGLEDVQYPDDPTSDLSVDSSNYLTGCETTEFLQQQIVQLQNCSANGETASPHVSYQGVLPDPVLNIVSNRCFVWKVPIPATANPTQSALADTPRHFRSPCICRRYSVYLQATLEEASGEGFMSVSLQGIDDMPDLFIEMINIYLLNLRNGEFALPVAPSFENPEEARAVCKCFTFQQLSDPTFVHDGAVYIVALLKT